MSDGTHSYVDDAENRITCVLDIYGQCSQGAVQYFYDAQGRRVGKQQGDTMEEYVYDPERRLISVHDGGANLLRTELYAGARRVATWNGNGLYWNHADWLGTERARSDGSGNLAEMCMDSPFGMNLSCTNPPDQSHVHFAGMEYDAARATIQGKVGWHTLRHSYSTLLRTLGTDLKVQ